jgi:hypothetical protein
MIDLTLVLKGTDTFASALRRERAINTVVSYSIRQSWVTDPAAESKSRPSQQVTATPARGPIYTCHIAIYGVNLHICGT